MSHTDNISCPECGQSVRKDTLDAHLHEVHRLYRVGKRRLPRAETQAVLQANLAQPGAVPEAMAGLERFLRLVHGRKIPVAMATFLADLVQRHPEASPSVAALLAPRRMAAAVSAYLASDQRPEAQTLALLVAPRLPQPLDRPLVRVLRRRISDPALPESLVLQATRALLDTTGPEGGRPLAILKALVSGLHGAERLARLHRLEALTGSFAALQAFLQHLEGHLRLRCPRCEARLPRQEMIDHLWKAHAMVLQGQTAREPWSLIDEWLELAARHKSKDYLALCRTFVRRFDPQAGPRLLQRRTLAHGIDDPEARRLLLADAAHNRASLCPRCYELVPIPPDPAPQTMSIHRGRLSCKGYRVEMNESGWVPRMEVEGPSTAMTQSRPERPRWTRRMHLLALAGPPVLLAFLVSIFDLGLPPLLPVLFLLTVAAGLSAVAVLMSRPRSPADHRAVDHAWSEVVPALPGGAIALADAEFVASLALASLTRGHQDVRASVLQKILGVTERLVAAGFGGARRLAALRRLALSDAVRTGKDRVLLMAAEIDSCFSGRLPLTYADGLLEACEAESWSATERARLKILLLESAFEAGFEVENLLEASDTGPALDAIIDGSDPEAIACLRLLWSLRASRPWEAEGIVQTAFEVAAEAESSIVLEHTPDLLLRHALPPRFSADGGEAGLLICRRGLILRGVLIRQIPRSLEVVEGAEGGALVIEGKRLRFAVSPEVLARRLERWARYLFLEFLPRLAEVQRWRSPHASAVLRAWGTARCPDCRRPLLPRVGDVGVALEEMRHPR